MRSIKGITTFTVCLFLMAGTARAQQSTTGPEPPPGTDRGLQSTKLAPVVIPGVPPYLWHHLELMKIMVHI